MSGENKVSSVYIEDRGIQVHLIHSAQKILLVNVLLENSFYLLVRDPTNKLS